MKKMFSKEVKIGIAFIIALFLLYFGINFLKGINIFKPSNAYVVEFDDVTGLTLSSPVLLNGFKVGLVYSMQLVDNKSNKIAVTINMDKGIKIPKDSKVNLDVSMLGSAAVTIVENPYTSTYYSPDDTIPGLRPKGLMESMAAVGTDLMPQVSSLLPKLDSILTGLQTIVNHPALNQSLNNIDIITKELAASSTELNTMMLNVKKDIPIMTHNMTKTSDDLAQFSSQLKSIDLVDTYKSVNVTLKNIEYLSNQMNSKNSSLGLLLNDKALYDSLNVTIGNASLLMQDLRNNPSKYINVKVF